MLATPIAAITANAKVSLLFHLLKILVDKLSYLNRGFPFQILVHSLNEKIYRMSFSK